MSSSCHGRSTVATDHQTPAADAGDRHITAIRGACPLLTGGTGSPPSIGGERGIAGGGGSVPSIGTFVQG
jgi:hypothetical protein